MATMPVLSSRGLDHDSVFKSGEFRVLEARQLARHCQCDGWNF